MVSHSSETLMQELQNQCYTVIWNCTQDRIKKPAIIHNYRNGGPEVPNLLKYLQTQNYFLDKIDQGS